MTEQPSDQPSPESPLTPPSPPEPTSTPTGTTGSEPAPTAQQPPVVPASTLIGPHILLSELDRDYLPLIKKSAVPAGYGVITAGLSQDSNRHVTLLDIPGSFGKSMDTQLVEMMDAYRRDPMRQLAITLLNSDENDVVAAWVVTIQEGGPNGKPKYFTGHDKYSNVRSHAGAGRALSGFHAHVLEKVIGPIKEYMQEKLGKYFTVGKPTRSLRPPTAHDSSDEEPPTEI